MRVLVTRPQPGAERTAGRLAELGHDVALMPLFKAEVTATLDDLPPPERISGLVATSARAFDLFGAGGVAEAGLRDIPVYVVGPATAQAAGDAGFVRVHEGGGTAQTLIQVITSDWGPESARAREAEARAATGVLVYLAGVPRTPAIETALADQNIDQVVVECYKMTEISYSTDIVKTDILSPVPEVVLLYSANAARRFSALLETGQLGKAFESSRFLCLSPSVSAELPDDLRRRTVVAESPDQDSLLVALAKLE